MESTDISEGLIANGEKVEKVVQCLISLLQKSTNLCGGPAKIKNLGIDLSKHQAHLELLKDKLRRVTENFMNKSNPSGASLRKRKVYNEKMTRVVEELTVEIENWVQAVYNDAIEGGNYQESLSFAVACVIGAFRFVGCVGSALGAVLRGNASATDAYRSLCGVFAAATSYNSYQGYNDTSGFKCGMKLLLNDAEELRKEVQGMKMDLKLDSVDLDVEEVP